MHGDSRPTQRRVAQPGVEFAMNLTQLPVNSLLLDLLLLVAFVMLSYELRNTR